MTIDIGHERCSELLLPYERGELSAPEAHAVERHLGACDQCAAERAGLAVLVQGPSDAMNASERSRLHAALDGEMHRVPEAAPPPAPGRRRGPRWGRLSTWGGGTLVGVAATLLLILGALVFGPRLARNDDQQQGGVQDVAESDRTQGPKPMFAAAPAPVPEAIPNPAQETASDEAGAGNAARKALPATMQAFGSFAATSKPFTTFATAYRAEDIAALRDRYLDDLSRAATTALRRIPLQRSPAAIVRECAELAIEQSRDPLLPAYATYTPVDGVESLVIGFVSSSDGSGPVDRYTILAWRGAECTATPSFVSGEISPAE